MHVFACMFDHSVMRKKLRLNNNFITKQLKSIDAMVLTLNCLEITLSANS